MKVRIDTVLIKLQFLILAGIIAAQVLGQTALSSLLFTLTFFLTVALWLTGAAGQISGTNLLALMMVVVSCLHVAANTLITGTEVSFSYIRKLVMFWATILFFAAMEGQKAEKSTVKFLFCWNSLIAAFLIGMYEMRREQMYVWNGRVTEYLTFGFTNPNLAAVFLSAVCILELLCGFRTKGRIAKIVHWALAFLMGYFVTRTRARNAQMLLIFFLIAYGKTLLLPGRPFRLNNWAAGSIALLPLLFAGAYLLCIYTPAIQEAFEFLVGEGKGLDSRVEVWTFALEQFLQSPVLGAYSQIVNSDTHAQMHNTHVDVLASYGIGVLGMLVVFLYRMLRSEDRQGWSGLCMAGFGALLLSGLGEAMLFSGGLGIYIYAGILRMLANAEEETT